MTATRIESFTGTLRFRARPSFPVVHWVLFIFSITDAVIRNSEFGCVSGFRIPDSNALCFFFDSVVFLSGEVPALVVVVLVQIRAILFVIVYIPGFALERDCNTLFSTDR